MISYVDNIVYFQREKRFYVTKAAIFKGRLLVPCTCDSSMGIHQKRLEDRDHVHHHAHDYQQPKLQ